MNHCTALATWTLSVLVLGLSASASAAGRLYAQAELGTADIRRDDGFSLERAGAREELTAEFDSGPLIGGAVGYAGERFAVELEYVEMENDIREPAASQAQSSQVRGRVPFINVWYQPEVDGFLQPYVGGGLGFAEVETDRASDSEVAVQVGVGVNWPLTRHLSLSGGLRYFSARRLSLNADSSEFSINYEGYAAHVGLRLSCCGRAQD